MKIRIKKRLLLGIIIFVFLNISLKLFIIDVVKVSGVSMEPTLINGSYLLVSKYYGGMRLPRNIFEIPWINNFVYYFIPDKEIDSVLQNTSKKYKHLKKIEIQRGDVVVFNLPFYLNSVAIKRCVGMPGDSINHYVSEKALFPIIPYKGMRLSNESLSIEQQKELRKSYFFKYDNDRKEWISLSNFYFMQGDNKDFSIDSRTWGLVPENHIFAKMLVVIKE